MWPQPGSIWTCLTSLQRFMLSKSSLKGHHNRVSVPSLSVSFYSLFQNKAVSVFTWGTEGCSVRLRFTYCRPTCPHRYVHTFFWCCFFSSWSHISAISFHLAPFSLTFSAALSLPLFVSFFSCRPILLFPCSESCWPRSFRLLGCQYWHLSR